MKRLLIPLLLLLTLSDNFQSRAQAQTFSDTFQNGLDTSQWQYAGGYGGGGETAQFVPQNVISSADGLHLVAIKDASGNITSGRIESVQVYRYGRFTFRAKLPAGKGFWPALWLRTPENDGQGNTLPINGEIDAMEGFGSRPCCYQSTLHHWHQGQFGGREQAIVTGPVDLSQAYHTFGVEWRPDHVTWLLDGQVLMTLRADQGFAIPAVPMRIVLDLSVGGSF